MVPRRLSEAITEHAVAARIQFFLLMFFVVGVSAVLVARPEAFAADGVHTDALHSSPVAADFALVKKHYIEGASSEIVSPPSVKACDVTLIQNKVRSNRARYMPMDDYRRIIELFHHYRSCHISFDTDMPLAFGGYVSKLVEVDLSVKAGHMNGCVVVRSRFARPDFRYAVCFDPTGVTIEQD